MPSRCINLQPCCAAIMETMRFVVSICDHALAGIAFAWAGIDCSECIDYSSCIDYLVFADYLLRGDYSLNSHCFLRSDFGVNASLGVSTDLGVSAGFGACAGYSACADFPLPGVFGMRACLPLRRGCLDRPALVNARTITR